MTYNLNRRAVLAAGTSLMATATFPARAEEGGIHSTMEHEAHNQMMNAVPADAPTVSMMVYPKMVALDLIGPMTVFKIMGCNLELVWKDKSPVSSDVGVPLMATHTFEEAHQSPDVLFVPGGIMGTIDCMNDPDVLSYLGDRGERAKWVTSVCTGSLILAAAGLLKDRNATSHWGVADLLPVLGATHVDQRVVRDGNRVTGAGVTAGIDFGLRLAAEMKDEETARRIQLIMEYSPEPPYQNGTPEEAGPARMDIMLERRKTMDSMAAAVALEAGTRLGTI